MSEHSDDEFDALDVDDEVLAPVDDESNDGMDLFEEGSEQDEENYLDDIEDMSDFDDDDSDHPRKGRGKMITAGKITSAIERRNAALDSLAIRMLPSLAENMSIQLDNLSKRPIYGTDMLARARIMASLGASFFDMTILE